ncbi:hypothetical protein AAMO2058_001746700 [Amorphochlora amoebiformis]
MKYWKSHPTSGHGDRNVEGGKNTCNLISSDRFSVIYIQFVVPSGFRYPRKLAALPMILPSDLWGELAASCWTDFTCIRGGGGRFSLVQEWVTRVGWLYA